MSGYLDSQYQKRRDRLFGSNPSDAPLPKDARLFNEAVGLPISSLTKQPSPVQQFQLDIQSYRGKDLIINKANKLGGTWSILRECARLGTVGDCVGYRFLFTSSQKGLASENIKRLTRDFQRSPKLSGLIKGDPTLHRLELVNGTEYLAIATEAAAGRSWELVKYIFADEAAHPGMLDDSEFFAALDARRSNTDGYMRLVSTPKGQRGTFYEKCIAAQAGEINAKYMVLPYSLGIGVFYTQEFIDEQRRRLGPYLFAQEYENAFISSANAAIEPDLVAKMQEDYESE